jgi:DNA repair exonuclease SbcCD ATPase subunit
MRWHSLIGTLFFAALAGCQPNGPAPAANSGEVKVKVDPKREEYLREARRKLDDADREMEVLRQKAAAASGDLRTKLEARLEELKPHRAQARRDLENLMADGERSWEEVKGSLDQSWSKLSDTMGRVREEFK